MLGINTLGKWHKLWHPEALGSTAFYHLYCVREHDKYTVLHLKFMDTVVQYMKEFLHKDIFSIVVQDLI